jgi:hypothetical protein
MCVALGHVLLVLLLLRATHQPHGSETGPDATEPLLLLNLSPPPSELPEKPQAQGTKGPKISQRRAAKLPSDEAPATTTVPDVLTPTPSDKPPVDWRMAAEDVARSLTARHDNKNTIGVQPGAAYRKCPPKRAFAWNREPSKAGFMGGLPYVRLGKRCILGLGFFGCGSPPEPNSHLLDGLHDPNASASSVPEDDNCDP